MRGIDVRRERNNATGRTYYYYKCATAKKKKGCNKKTVQKEWLENLVVQETMKLIQDDAVIERIVQLVMDFQNQENTRSLCWKNSSGKRTENWTT